MMIINFIFKGYILKIIGQDNGYFFFNLLNSKMINKNVYYLFLVLKKSYLFKFESLLDITANQLNIKIKEKFSVIYNLISVFFNIRIFFSLTLNKGFVNSLLSIFKSAFALEREIWDMFGIFFF